VLGHLSFEFAFVFGGSCVASRCSSWVCIWKDRRSCSVRMHVCFDRPFRDPLCAATPFLLLALVMGGICLRWPCSVCPFGPRETTAIGLRPDLEPRNLGMPGQPVGLLRPATAVPFRRGRGACDVSQHCATGTDLVDCSCKYRPPLPEHAESLSSLCVAPAAPGARCEFECEEG